MNAQEFKFTEDLQKTTVKFNIILLSLSSEVVFSVVQCLRNI